MAPQYTSSGPSRPVPSGLRRHYKPSVCASRDIPAQGAGNNGQLRSDYDNDETSSEYCGTTYPPGCNPSRIAYPSSHTDTYTYDSLGRLTQTVGTPFDSGYFGENLTYSYDDFGNMTCVQTPYTYGNCPEITSDPATNRMTLVGTAALSYDTNGNLLTDGTTLNTYSYDAEGRLTKINNAQHVSISYTYNALGQLVEDNQSNWGGPDVEIFYDPYGRRIGDYDYQTRGAGYWKTGYVVYDAPVGHYDGNPQYPTTRTYTTTYRNSLDSMRWETNDGTDAEADALYRPFGDEWYTCTAYGSGISSYANMDPYCVCYGVAMRPNSRPYIPGLGRSMSTRPSDLLDPDLLNKYAYAGNDPINKVDSGGSEGPTQPPLPGLDQNGNAIQGNPDVIVGLSFDFRSSPYDPNAWVFPETIDASTQSSPGASAAPQQQDVPLPETAQIVLPLVYQSTKSLQSPWAPVVWYGTAFVAEEFAMGAPGLGYVGIQAEAYLPGSVPAVTQFSQGYFTSGPIPPTPWAIAGRTLKILGSLLGQ